MESPLERIRRNLSAGVRDIAVDPGTYRVAPPAGCGTHLALRGLRDVVIDFGGAELRGLVNTRFFLLEDCADVVVRNVTLDYETLPFTQAAIVAADADGTLSLDPTGDATRAEVAQMFMNFIKNVKA